MSARAERLIAWTLSALYVITPLIAGHIVVASGILPGYRGVWRSMHLGGRLDRRVAQRLWPAWLIRKHGGSDPSERNHTA